MTGERGKNREDKSGHDSNARTTSLLEQWTRLLGQDSWHRTRQKYDSKERTAKAG